MSEGITVTEHALLRYADRCYGEIYDTAREIPAERAEQFNREICTHLTRGTRLTDEQAEQFHSLWPLPRKEKLDLKQVGNYYHDDLLLVIRERGRRMIVVTVLGAAPPQLRYLEDIGIRGRRPDPPPPIDSFEWLRTHSRIEIMLVDLTTAGELNVPSGHVMTWLERADRIERANGNGHKLLEQRVYVEETVKPAASKIVTRRTRLLVKGSDRHMKGYVGIVRVLCTTPRALDFLQEVVYERQMLPPNLLEVPLNSGTVLGFDPTGRGTFTFRLLHVPSAS